MQRTESIELAKRPSPRISRPFVSIGSAFALSVVAACSAGTVEDRPGTDTRWDESPAEAQGSCDAVDKAGSKHSYSVALCLDF